jgi:hypothetical protein
MHQRNALAVFLLDEVMNETVFAASYNRKRWG